VGDAVAQADIFNFSIVVDSPGNHGHGVSVFKSQASGQSSSISRQISKIAGIWRAA